MINVFKYYPKLGFRASLYWRRFSDGGRSKIKASYVKNTPLANMDGWLHAGPDNFTNEHRYLVNVDFYFSVFSYAGKYVYQIKAIPHHAGPQHFAGYRLEASANGYLGLYKPPLLLDNPPYWHLPGLDPFDLTDVDNFEQMSLWGGDGPHTGKGLVTGNDDDPTFYYLGRGGRKGTLEIENIVLDHPRP